MMKEKPLADRYAEEWQELVKKFETRDVTPRAETILAVASAQHSSVLAFATAHRHSVDAGVVRVIEFGRLMRGELVDQAFRHTKDIEVDDEPVEAG